MNNPFGNDTSTGDTFKIDFSNVQSDLIPKGEYPVECTALTEEKSKSSGDDMWTWSFEIVNGDYKGRKLNMYTSLKPSALGILKRALVALGVIDNDAKGEQDLSASAIIGSRALGVIQHEKYNGEDRHKLKGLKKWNGEHDDDILF